MPSTSFNSRTYSRKFTKRKSEDASASVLEVKRRKIDPDDEDITTDIEDNQPPPTRVPRDLSQIFDAVPAPSAPSTSPGKLAKRMLSRSRTESFIASGSGTESSYSSTNSIVRTPSLPTVQDTRNTPPSPSTKLHSPEAKQPPVPRRKSSGRTYAGASRSFLVPIPINPSSLEQLQEELDDEFASRESYTSLRTRWGVDDSEDDPHAYGSPSRAGSNHSTPNVSPSKGGKGKGKARPELVPLPNGMMNPLKSITELRNRGESRRFLDEVGYLWEGLDKSGAIGLRRASALEINTKLCEPEFARKAKTADFIGQTWDFLREAGAGQEEDKILDVLLAFFCALVARDLASLSDLAQRPSSSFTSTLFSLLSSFSPSTDPLAHVSDPAQLRKLGMSKKDQNLLSNIRDAISSSLFPSGLSTSLLLSHTLAALPPSVIGATPLNVKSLLSTLNSHLSPLQISPLSTFTTTSSNTDELHVAFNHVYNVLSLLDSYLLGGWSSPADNDISTNQQIFDDARDAWFADAFVAFAIYTEVVNLRQIVISSSHDKDKTRQCALTTLRLLVGLTHSDKAWCVKLTKHEYCMPFVLRTILRGHSERAAGAKDGRRGTIKQGDSEGDVKRNGRGSAQVKQETKKSDDESEDEESANRDEGDGADEALDTLCLGLGILTNLVQMDVEGAKNLLRETDLSSDCTPSRCLKTCRCPQRSSALEALVRVYEQLLSTSPSASVNVKREPSPDTADPGALLAAGETRLLLSHLSLLFGLLMLDNSENQTVILELLPLPTAHSQYREERGKVDMLIANAKEFAYIYSGSEGNDAAEGENVKTVIRFLEALREM